MMKMKKKTNIQMTKETLTISNPSSFGILSTMKDKLGTQSYLVPNKVVLLKAQIDRDDMSKSEKAKYDKECKDLLKVVPDSRSDIILQEKDQLKFNDMKDLFKEYGIKQINKLVKKCAKESFPNNKLKVCTISLEK